MNSDLLRMFGVIISTGIVLGFFLFPGNRTWLKALVIAGVLLFMDSYFHPHEGVLFTNSVPVTVAGLLSYGAGLVTGVFLRKKVKLPSGDHIIEESPDPKEVLKNLGVVQEDRKGV